MKAIGSTLVCAGCGLLVASGPEPHGLPFRCPRANGDDVDHVLRRVLDPGAVGYPTGAEANPFLRYRRLFHSYHVARGRNLTDEEYAGMVDGLDRVIAAVDGVGFVATPFARSDALSRALGFTGQGGVWVKDETRNVSGSHKARHLMGVMLYLLVGERAGGGATASAPLAIASCGNAALAAAIVAKAAGRRLEVFIPPSADPAVVDRLGALGAALTICHRRAGEAGDPCYRRFRDAIRAGALPFCCQGNENGLTIEGGATIGYEMIDALGGDRLDAVVVQVGGGALASACVLAFNDAACLGRVRRVPRLFTVQTRGAFPLQRAYDRLAARIADRVGVSTGVGRSRAAIAADLQARVPAQLVVEERRSAAAHRSAFMWPWEEEPRSLAHGILDDETYDWLAVTEGMILTGGYPIVVGEETLAEANRLARNATGINVDHTGSAGLAGLLQVVADDPGATSWNVAVIFSGVKRSLPGSSP